MPVWVLLSIGALVSWGVSGFLRKQATAHTSPWLIVVFQSLTVMTMATIAVVARGGPVLTTNAVLLALAGGSFQYLANISLAFSLARGPASIVVPVTSMYPVVTLVLAFLLLGETINATQALGLLCSAGALYAFSR
jgi:transporter family protein